MQNHIKQEQEINCQFCNRKIAAPNHQLHEARCVTLSTRIRKQNYNRQNQRQEKPQESNSQHIKESLSSRLNNRSQIGTKSRQKIFNEQKIQQSADFQLIPCSNCGYMQTLAELDTHPKECAHQQFECKYCSQSFPTILMDEHLQQCEQRPQIPEPINQHISHNIESQQEQEQQHIHHPYYQYYNLRRPNNPRIVSRTTTTINGITIVEQTDQLGNVTRRQLNQNNSNNRNPIRTRFTYQPFGSIERGGIFENRGNPFRDFFRILQNFANQGRQSQGLTKEQIRELERLKYKRPLQKPQTQQKDLCTICYCDFQQNEKIIKLKCKHLYHQQCIVKWLESNAKCPVCKTLQTNRPIFNEDD